MGYDGRLRLRKCNKVGCRAACPQAAAEIYGNAKPYGLPLVGGRRPRRPAEVGGGGRYAGGMNFSPTGYLLAGVGRKVAEGSRPLPTMQKIKGWQWQGSVNELRTRGAREGGSPPLCSWRAVARERVATHSPSESPSHLTVTAPFDKGAFASPLRGFGGTPEF